MTGLHSSRMTKKRSNLLMMAALTATLALRVLVRSYRPNTGLAAARMLVRAFSVAWMPVVKKEEERSEVF